MKLKHILLIAALLIVVSIYLGQFVAGNPLSHGHKVTTTTIAVIKTRTPVSKSVAGTLITGNPTYTFGDSGSSYTNSSIWQKANKKKN